MFTTVWRMAERSRLEPAEPRATTGSPSRSSRLGAIMEVMRSPGSSRPKPPGLRSSSPSMLFRRMPVPGAITPEPDPFELERLAMPPSASTALVWVVPVGRRAQSRSMLSSSRRSAWKRSSRTAFAAAPARTTAR